MSDDEVERMARAAYHAGRGLYFTREQLEAMPDMIRETIESEARRLYGVRRSPPLDRDNMRGKP